MCKAAASLLLLLPGLVVSLCYPDQPVEECLLSQEADSDTKEGVEKTENVENIYDDKIGRTRSSFITGRFCFSSSGYYGACATALDCVRPKYSYSRSCGWDLVCCKAQNKTRVTTSRRRTTTGRPVWARRTKPPATKTTTKRVLVKSTTTSLSTSFGSCGVSQVNFIYGGKEAKRGQFPFMVSFVYRYTSSYVENFCGGVLISRRHVLTAAHCFNNVREKEWASGEVDVRIGLTDLDKVEDPLASANIKKVTIHPNYQKRFSGAVSPVNDIAIITLDRSVTSPLVNTVCLPTTSTRTAQALVAGWGQTSQDREGESERKLQFAYLDTYSVEVCQAKYNKLMAGIAKVVISRDMMCAGNTVADTCAGDSGGPMLQLDQDFRWTVIGVISFGPSSCGNVVPGVYTRVDRYTDWIVRKIAN